MDKLLSGVVAYRRGFHTQREDLFNRLKNGQAPEVLFITCSDSRVSPAHITQCDPGELFVIRNAGNLVPPYCPSGGGEAGTLEYALMALPIRHIIVCGHSGCGAMAGLLDAELPQKMPQVAAWLKYAEPTRQRVQGVPAEQQVSRAVELNVLQQLTNLQTHPSVAARLREGLTLHGWLYDIGSGGVRAYDRERGSFVLINGEPSSQ